MQAEEVDVAAGVQTKIESRESEVGLNGKLSKSNTLFKTTFS